MPTKTFFASAVVLLAFAGSLSAQAPAGATGKCKDGTYTMSTTKKGACSKHGGVESWLAGAAPKPTGVRPSAPPAPAPTPPPVTPKPKTTTMGAAPAGAPAGATALCTDGTYSMSQHRRGTCSKHKGVKTWLKEVPA